MKSNILPPAFRAFVFVLLVSSCSSDDCNNDCKELALDCNCCPTISSYTYSTPSISNVTMFLETSGSMSGFMPPSGNTEFQKIVPNIISKLKVLNIAFYSIKESNQRPIKINAGDGTDKIVRGQFNIGKNTAIPAMIDTINHYQEDDNVTILVSDMIFSPKDKSEISQEITQIAEKIRSKNSPITASLLLLTSDFHSKNHNNTDSSPYYILVRGKTENVELVKSKIKQAAALFNQTINEVNFGYKYPSPYYTIIPYYQKSKVGLIQRCDNSKNERYRINNIEGADSLSFWVGLDMVHFPGYSQNREFLKKHLNIRSQGAKSKIQNFMSKSEFLQLLSDQTDKDLAQKCTHFIQVKVSDFGFRAAILSFELSDDTPEWINYYNHEITENADINRNQTFELRSIYTALSDAFDEKAGKPLFDSIKISLVKK